MNRLEMMDPKNSRMKEMTAGRKHKARRIAKNIARKILSPSKKDSEWRKAVQERQMERSPAITKVEPLRIDTQIPLRRVDHRMTN